MWLVTDLIETALNSLCEQGISFSTRKHYKQVGFGGFLRYCQKREIAYFQESDCSAYQNDRRKSYENGEIKISTWRISRRSCAILSAISKGDVQRPPTLPAFETVECSRKRLKQPPSDLVLADNDNIFGLSYRLKQELEKHDVPHATMLYYLYCGFNRILNRFTELGIDKYDKKIVNQLVAEIREKYSKLNTGRGIVQYIRKVAEFMDEFHTNGCITIKKLPPWWLRSPEGVFFEALNAYAVYERKIGRITERTIRSNCGVVRRFLCFLEDNGHKYFNSLTLLQLSTLFTEYCKGYSKGGLSTLLYAIKTFLSAICENELCNFNTEQNFSLAIPRVCAKHRSPKVGFSAEQITATLNCIHKDTVIGKRDYAIILLGAVTGLRACDATTLKFESIDWHNNGIKVVQSKTGQFISLPLTAEVGNAIADYILNARPESNSPYIFLSISVPYKCISGGAIGNKLRQYALASETMNEGQDTGFHNLRRGFGNRLLNSQVPFPLIGEMLGHKSTNAVRSYIAADVNGLEMCAVPLASIMQPRGNTL